jgi:hypothetical protein
MKNFLLLILGLFLLSSYAECVATDLTQHDIIKKIMDEEGALFYDTKQFDLDRDRINEFIVTYYYGLHHRGIKVIKFEDDKSIILFEQTTNTPMINFEIINNVPTIILEVSDYTPDYATGGTYKEMYQWDGKTFKLGG